MSGFVVMHNLKTGCWGWRGTGRTKGEELRKDTCPCLLTALLRGKLLPTLDQDSLECEAWISIWGIGRNV